jgi:hypothetical protein
MRAAAGEEDDHDRCRREAERQRQETPAATSALVEAGRHPWWDHLGRR